MLSDISSPHDDCQDLLASSGDGILDVIDSPRTLHSVPFMQFSNISNSSVAIPHKGDDRRQLIIDSEAQNSL